MAQDKKKKGTGRDLMMGLPGQAYFGDDPILEGTGQPGELANTPATPDSVFSQEQKMQQEGINQDPALEGTGQPGELYGTPDEPSEQMIQDMEEKRIISEGGESFQEFQDQNMETPAEYIHRMQAETVYHMHRKKDFELNKDINFDYYLNKGWNLTKRLNNENDKTYS